MKDINLCFMEVDVPKKINILYESVKVILKYNAVMKYALQCMNYENNWRRVI